MNFWLHETIYKSLFFYSNTIHIFFLIWVDGGFTEWSECSTTCGDGLQTRSCTNPIPQYGGIGCDGSLTQECNLTECPSNFNCSVQQLFLFIVKFHFIYFFFNQLMVVLRIGQSVQKLVVQEHRQEHVRIQLHSIVEMRALASYLKYAMQLNAQVNCVLISFCSKNVFLE